MCPDDARIFLILYSNDWTRLLSGFKRSDDDEINNIVRALPENAYGAPVKKFNVVSFRWVKSRTIIINFYYLV